MVFTHTLELNLVLRQAKTAKPISLFYISIFINTYLYPINVKEIYTQRTYYQVFRPIYIGTPIGVSRQRHELSSRYRTRRYCFKTCVHFIRSVIYH